MALFKKRHKPAHLWSSDEFDRLVAEGKPVLVDFMQYGCQPCRIMDGIVNEIADEFREHAIVIKADAARVPDLFHNSRSDRHRLSSCLPRPATVFINGGASPVW